MRAVLFDFDFTLADSSPGVIECFAHGFARVGLPPADPEAVRRTIGLTLPEALRRLHGVEDAALARDVLLRDDRVDHLKDTVFRVLLTHMMADPGTIERALGLILISRNIERIADHATNIAEEVIFLVEAKDVRHHHSGE